MREIEWMEMKSNFAFTLYWRVAGTPLQGGMGGGFD
jgi:hypothetical protein